MQFKYNSTAMQDIDKVEKTLPDKGKKLVGSLFHHGNIVANVYISKKRQNTNRKKLYNGLFLSVQVISKPTFDMEACEGKEKSYNQRVSETQNKSNPWALKPITCEEEKREFNEGIDKAINDAVMLVYSEYSRQLALQNVGKAGTGENLSQQDRVGLSIVEVLSKKPSNKKTGN